MTDHILILVTCASTAEAETIADALLDQRLIACASVGPPVRSRYWWQGKLASGGEVQLWLKTRGERFEAVEAKLRELHSYEVPEILAFPVAAGSAPYLQWLDASTRDRAGA